MSTEPHQKFISTLLYRLDQEEISFEDKLHILVLLTNFVIQNGFNNKWIIVRHALKMHGVNEELVHAIEKPEDFSSLSYSKEEYRTHYNNLIKKLKLFSSNALSKNIMASLIAKEYCAQRAIEEKSYLNNAISAYHMFQSNQKKQQIIQNLIASNLNKLHENASRDKTVKDLIRNYVIELQHKAQMQQPLIAYTQQLQKLLPQSISSKEIQQALTNFPHLLNINSVDNFRKALEKEYTNFALKEYKVAYFTHNNATKEKITEPLFVPVHKMRLINHGATAIDYSYPDYQAVITAYSTKDPTKLKLSENEVLFELNPTNTTEQLLHKPGNKEGTVIISHIPISAVSQITHHREPPKHLSAGLIDSDNTVINTVKTQKGQVK